MIRLRRLPRIESQTARWPIAQTVVRAVVSGALAALLIALLSSRLGDIYWADVRTGFVGVPFLHWVAALLATGISFWAVGQYDVVLHRHFATRLPDQQTRRSGICAIAVSQTTGFGVITGAIVRWRMLPAQPLSQAVRLTIAVALSFLVGWLVVTAVVLVVLPAAPFKSAACLVLALALAFCALCLFARPAFVRLPNGFTLFPLLGLCAVDTLAAGIAFYLLFPHGADLTFGQFLPAFLLALGAGLVSGSPGGVGAFELTILALLPAVSEPDLLAAVLAWRAIYYALPALIGAGLAIRGPKPAPLHPLTQVCAATPPHRGAAAGLHHQGQHQIMAMGQAGWLCARTPHVLVGLFDPSNAQGIADLVNSAKSENRLPALYHATARVAVIARRLGFNCLRIAQEAWVYPATFDLAAPPCAGLRRKLRRAGTAGVTVTAADPDGAIPWQQLDQIAVDWAKSHGGERGFSMGRYSRDYVRAQGLYIAWIQARPVAFVTFHRAQNDWALDLMRHGNNIPDGTMHALIHAAITDAARGGVARLSLAAVPDIVIGPCNAILHRLITRLTRRKTTGLMQFKSSFAPKWTPLYLAVPQRSALPLICAEVARDVFWPKRLPNLPLQRTDICVEHHHDDYEFASARSPWHRQAE